MREDEVITLDNNKKYLLLLESEKFDDSFFLSVVLDENNEPTQEYAVLKEIIEDDESYVEQVSNPLVLNELLEDYREQYSDLYQN